MYSQIHTHVDSKIPDLHITGWTLITDGANVTDKTQL